jgi:putative oxidoreductase
MRSPSDSLAPPATATETLDDILTLLGRLLMAYLFIVEGYGKIGAYAGVQGYMAQAGVPSVLLPLVILAELGGGVAIALGLFTRPVAIALAGFCVLTALLFHHGAAEAVGQQKDLCIAGGFLILASRGGGAWALDKWVGAVAPGLARRYWL